METDNKINISITILTFNRCDLLRELLLSLNSLQYQPLEIIVVDNHSEDDTQQIVTTEFPSVIYNRLAENIGIAARNIAMGQAQGDVLITLDDDVFGLDDQAILNILDLFQVNKNLGAVNFKVVNHIDGAISNWIHHCRQEDFSEKEFLTYEITEGAVAFRKSVLDKVGYYQEYFFLSHEGPDLAFRILESGHDVIYSNKVCLTHCHSQLGRKKWFKYYYDTRNHIWLAIRNFPVTYGAVYLARGLFSMLVYSARDGYLFYWMKAIIDGIRGIGRAYEGRKVLSQETMDTIRVIDKDRPSLGYMIKQKLFKRGIRP
jgi:GT2 family glycosyltransferase